MNHELDLDDLDLAEEEVEETVSTPEIKEPVNLVEIAKDEVTAIIGQNIFDRDLEQALLKVVNDHFQAISEQPSYHSDIFRIPDLNLAIWESFRKYETFVHENKFENIDLNEIGKIIREQVVPKITNYLRDLTIQQSLQS